MLVMIARSKSMVRPRLPHIFDVKNSKVGSTGRPFTTHRNDFDECIFMIQGKAMCVMEIVHVSRSNLQFLWRV
jgi:hypothetical protein